MSKYIDIEKLKTEIERQRDSALERQKSLEKIGQETVLNETIAFELNKVLSLIDSHQQEQLKDKQIIIITESHGDSNIYWDCRSLDDVSALLKSAESFITDKQVEKMAGPGSGPDYATEEGRYSYLFKRQRKQPEVDLEKDINACWRNWLSPSNQKEVEGVLPKTEFTMYARHFYELGLNARKEE